MKNWIFIFILFNAYTSFSQIRETVDLTKTARNVKTTNYLATNPKMDNYDVVYYGLNLEATNANATISAATVTIKAKVVNSPMTEFVIQLINALTVSQVKINDQVVVFTHQNNEISFNCPSAIAVGYLFTVEVKYSGIPPQGRSDGWQNRTSGIAPVTWTLSESFHAYEWFPVKQVLTDKADSANVYITVPSNLIAASNGILKNVVDVAGSKKRYEWQSRYPIDYYLISVTIADYIEYDTYAHPVGLANPLLIQNYIYNVPGLLTQYKNAIDGTAAMIELFSEKFGMYPFANEKYGHVMAPIGGGMEHQTLTTLSTYENWLIAHELGHMWFGDYVTCSTWQDIWINEGFASYTEYVNLQYLSTQASADSWMVSAQNSAKSVPGGSVYLSLANATDENMIFSSQLSYDKGAAIIHMLRYEINNDVLFFNLIKEFLSRFGHKTATGADFKGVVNELTGQDYTWFFDQWYYGYGFPTFSFQYGFNSESKPWITVSQTPSSASTPLFKTSMELKLTFDDNSTSTQRILISEKPQTFTFDLPKIKSIQVDPQKWLLMKTGTITSIGNLNSEDLKISIGPNPFSDKIQFSIAENFQNIKVSILDVTGKVMNQSTYNEQLFEIDGSRLPKGIYIVKVSNGKYTSTRKLVKE